jgi:hypothetical protein
MRNILLTIVATLFLAVAANAAPCGMGGATNVLNAGFSCEAGGLTFSNFSAVNAGNAPNPSVFLVNFFQVGNFVNLTFNPSLSAMAGSSADIFFYFTVTGGVNQVDLTVSGTNAAISELVCGPGGVNMVTNTCNSGPPLANLVNFSQAPTVFSSVFPLTQTINIFKDIMVEGPGELSSFTQSFGTNPIPEPATMLLLGTGLAGIAAKLRRRRTSTEA